MARRPYSAGEILPKFSQNNIINNVGGLFYFVSLKDGDWDIS